MLTFTRASLKNGSAFRSILPNGWFSKLYHDLHDVHAGVLSEAQFANLLLSACRDRDYECTSTSGRKHYLHIDSLERWATEKLAPNLVRVSLDDSDALRLIVFSMAIAQAMFSGESRAAISAKGFRERRRSYEAIVVDQFTGKMGEVILKRYITEKIKPAAQIEIDWEISQHRERYQNDIPNASKKVSIKSSPSLAGVWAEAPGGYDYGVMVKCIVPQAPLLQFFKMVCGLRSLLDFADNALAGDRSFVEHLNRIKKEAEVCGSKPQLAGFVCGYFSTRGLLPTDKGQQLEYLGEVREKRYLLRLRELRWKFEDWKLFLEELGL